MSGVPVNPLTVAGGALLTLEQVRDSTDSLRETIAGLSAKADLADLRFIARKHGLPVPKLSHGGAYGIVGSFRGATDKLIEYATREWADAFATGMTFVEPLLLGRDRDGKAVVDPGWVVMRASVRGLRFTIGGRLMDPEAGR